MTTQTIGVADRLGADSTSGPEVSRLRLRAPHFRQKAVERTQLLAGLAEGRECRVVHICAPAGFGKTILAAQLIEHDPRPSCWIALERSDNDPIALLKDLVCMLKQVGSIAPRIVRELESRVPRVDEVVLPLLAGQLGSCAPFMLVLDDLELVTRRDSLAILSFLVDHLPPGSQVVLVTRTDHGIALGRLRAAGEVLDLRAADLAFDAFETRELLATCGVRLTDPQVKEVRALTEGWPTALALAMLSRTGRSVMRERPASAIGASRQVAAYLMEQVVESQPPNVRHFLLSSAVLWRMSPGLCDAALAISDSAQILAALERQSLFVVSLDGDGEWYRYHQLFRDLLQTEGRRQQPEVIGPVLSRAARWHEDRGDAREAFEYAHECGDLQRAGRVLLGSTEALIAHGHIETLRGWLARCSREEIESDPQLALAGAWVALLSGEAADALRLATVASTTGDLDVPSADGATSLRSSLANLRATVGADGVAQMLSDGEYVVAAERRAATQWMMDGWRNVATAHLLDGRPEEAIAAFAEVLSLTKGHADRDDLAIHCLGYSALAAADAGDWRRARKWAREAHAMATEGGLAHIAQSVAAHTAHASVLLHDGLMPQAMKALQDVRRILPMLHAMQWFEADINVRCAHISLDLGDTETALELADTARNALQHYPDPGTLPSRLAALDARLSSGGELHLTPSELRLIPLLSSHLSLQEIGDRVYLSRATIKTHTDSIYRKLSVCSRSEAVDRLEALGVCHRSTARLYPSS